MSVINLLVNFLTYKVVIFLLVLGLLVFVHEFGHFLFARLFGVRVLIFKLGFGKFWWRRVRGHTEYGVGWIPIGGYVKLFGDPAEMEELKPEQVSPADKKETLFAQPAWKKILIFAGGPVMNIVLAFLIAPIVYLVGIQQLKADSEPPVVGGVYPDSPAAKAGIEPGDLILSVGGKLVPTFRDLMIQEALNPNQTLTYRTLRQGREMEVKLTLAEAKPDPIGYSGIVLPRTRAAIGETMPGMPAVKAGLKPGDRILAINGSPVVYWDELRRLIEAGDGREMAVRVRRGEQELEFRMTPEQDSTDRRWVIGITPQIDTVLVRTGLVKAVQLGSRDALQAGVLTVAILWKIITFQVSPRTVGGPVMIAGVVGEAAQTGFSYLVSLIVLISVNLGILNLLPLPPFDGGHILFAVIEAVIRREINVKYKEAIFRVGMTCILALFVLITVNDFMRYRESIAEWFKELAKGLGIL